ncbi:hypothetical protein B2J93_1911 [Marssonina coronariae]|uniref:Signal peptide peptidase n=1 Tax=Diplocarpon coronariae TaxID=2795749 RepID=A0A218YWQ7_9HELO|nr:hypothetical protein B2J93_1911 [Marssonina coronariae]
MDTFSPHIEGDGSSIIQFVGKWSYLIYHHRELLQMYLHLILAAIFPIYIGSHASLKRPPSAALPKKKIGPDGKEEKGEKEIKIEGLTPSDAVLFPIVAGITLGGLYWLIKWLEDPKLLNKILNIYFSTLGIFGVGKLVTDYMNVTMSFWFPSAWSDGKETYYIEPLLREQVTGSVNRSRVQTHRHFVDKTNPLPGFFSSVKFPGPVNKLLWSTRALAKEHWVFKGYLHGVGSIKSKVFFNDVLGLVIGVAAIAAYNLNGKKPPARSSIKPIPKLKYHAGKEWWLTNLMGFAFCYGTLQLMSPTTFWTGTLVLIGLFIYDIVMVFYTPLMVTVATTLEVPIKLVFPGPKRGSMLGLGDIVLPGIIMALALRFDLYLHYLRKQRIDTKPAIPSQEPGRLTNVRAEYVEATGRWGERFWTRRANKGDVTEADGARFPKVYFRASLVGYVLAMLVTLVVMNIFNHAQPALLYLVPGVLTALWGTALVRGELRLMWEYNEDGEWGLEETHGVEGEQKKSEGWKAKSGEDEDKKDVKATIVREGEEGNEYKNHVFLFSLEMPSTQGFDAKKEN